MTSVGPVVRRGGTVTVIEVAVGVPVIVARAPPKETKLPAWKPLPVIVTTVPPVTGPEEGVMLVIIGPGVTAVPAAKPPGTEAAWPSGLTTRTSAGPAGSGGAVTTSVVAVGAALNTAGTLLKNT